MGLSVEMYKHEMAESQRNYERHIVCLDKTPDEFQTSVTSLMDKAIKAYENRGPGLRHGIALDKQLTIILSQTTGERPMCGIYFNLSSPYQKKAAAKAAKAADSGI